MTVIHFARLPSTPTSVLVTLLLLMNIEMNSKNVFAIHEFEGHARCHKKKSTLQFVYMVTNCCESRFSIQYQKLFNTLMRTEVILKNFTALSVYWHKVRKGLGLTNG